MGILYFYRQDQARSQLFMFSTMNFSSSESIGKAINFPFVNFLVGKFYQKNCSLEFLTNRMKNLNLLL